MPSPESTSPNSEKWAHAGAIAFAFFFLGTSYYISLHRLFWYDEVFTTLTTRLPDVHSMWRALVEDNYDPMPFGFFLVARVFDKLFGPGEIGIRLPAMLGLFGGMLLVYDAARRLSNRLHGFIAVALVSCSLLPFYGYEGRSYGLYFFFASFALWAWITEKNAIVLGAIFLAGVLIHYYMVLCLVPLALDELTRWRPGTMPRSRIIGAIVGAVIGVGILTPQVLASKRVYDANFWAAPSLVKMPSVIGDLFPPALALLVVGALWTLIADGRKVVVEEPMSSAERTCWYFLAIPFAAFLLAKFVTHAYHSRYLIATVPGFAAAVSVLLWRRFHEVRRVSIGLLAILAGYGFYSQMMSVTRADRIPPQPPSSGPEQDRTRQILSMEDKIWADGRKYIVIQGRIPLLFLQARYYSHHPERYVMLNDRETPQAHYYPMNYWVARDVKEHYREAAFVDPTFEIVETMNREGVRTFLRYPGFLPVSYME